MRVGAAIFIAAMAFLLIWWLAVRPIVASQEQFKEFFGKLDEVEATGWFKLQMKLKGFKMRIWSTFLIVAPLVMALLEFVGAIDQTLIVPLFPEKLQPFVPLMFSAIGVINLQLRKHSNTPDGYPVPVDGPSSFEVPTEYGRPNVELTVAPSFEAGKVIDIVNVRPL